MIESKASKTSTLLQLLNADPADIGFLAYGLYGDDAVASQKKTFLIISNVKQLGWEIFRSGDKYILSNEHYQLIRDNRRLIERWGRTRRLTPENLADGRGGKKAVSPLFIDR